MTANELIKILTGLDKDKRDLEIKVEYESYVITDVEEVILATEEIYDGFPYGAEQKHIVVIRADT